MTGDNYIKLKYQDVIKYIFIIHMYLSVYETADFITVITTHLKEVVFMMGMELYYNSNKRFDLHLFS